LRFAISKADLVDIFNYARLIAKLLLKQLIFRLNKQIN
jgi:hypothetical protein